MARAIDLCAAATRPSDALKEDNRRTFESLLVGGVAALQGLRVLLLSDSTDYNALAYAGQHCSAQLLFDAELAFCWPCLRHSNPANRFRS